MKFQRKRENGKWTDEDRIDQFVDRVLERETWYASRIGREPMTTRQQVLDFLATGETMDYDDDWYAQIRDADAPPSATPVQTAASAAKHSAKMISCDCGHKISQNLVMSASLGTSCPDCYDRMSD